MSYAERDIAGRGTCTAAQLRESLVKRGRYLASQGDRWAPGGIYREPLEGIEHIIIEECERYPGYEVNADGVTVQINIETAGLQSLFWIERANPGGIGAIDSSPGDALWFTRDTLKPDGREIPFAEAARRGIRAMIAKLLNYRFGEGPWTDDDPRAFAIRLKRWMGSCITFADLQGKWATSPTYATTIDSVWAALAAIPGGTMATPYEHVIPGMVDLRPLLKRNPNGGSAGRKALSQKSGVVVHFNGPDVGADDRAHIINVAAYHCTKDFSSNGSGAIGDGIMYHVAVADGGEVYLLRDLEAGLWHSGSNWNDHSIAIYVPIGINQRATPVQLQALSRTVDAIRSFTGEGRERVKGHKELSSTDCPGTLMPDFVLPYRAGRDLAATPEPVQDPNARYFSATNLWVVNDGPWRMLDAWYAMGGMAECGYPQRGMTGFGRTDGAVEQVFDNLMIEIYPDGTVRKGGLGMRYVALLELVAA